MSPLLQKFCMRVRDLFFEVYEIAMPISRKMGDLPVHTVLGASQCARRPVTIRTGHPEK